MRLLSKTTLYFLLAMVPLLFATGFFLYLQFSKEMNLRMDQELIAEELQWIQYLQTEADNGVTFTLRTPEILIYPVNAPITTFPTIENSFEVRDNSKLPYRQLSHVVQLNGIPYSITIRRTQEQKVLMEENLTKVMLFVFAGLFIATLIFNWIISKNIWKPFRRSLQKIRDAELQKMAAIRFEKTNILEFNELNTSLNLMADKIYRDYVNMKEFTENAAHEMQTPLAIVQSKMELMLQDSNLNDNQVKAVLDSTSALSRLSKLNQSLLLLAKIENNQYETDERVNLSAICKKYVKLFGELVNDKHLQVKEDYQADFKINLHPILADSLVSNLLGNAIKYNFSGGAVSIETTEKGLTISNTSNSPAIDQNQLFKRFISKTNHSDTSNGLGLAIVKRICDIHQLAINYHAEKGMHTFSVYKK